MPVRLRIRNPQSASQKGVDAFMALTVQAPEKLAPPIPWLASGQSFPPLEAAWGCEDPAPGLLAAGDTLDVPTLVQAYSLGVFPWFSPGQPVLWWSPDPRMVLKVRDFRLHRSLRQSLRRFQNNSWCEIRIDTAFEQVITACSSKPRAGQNGTWIVPAMVDAYIALHHKGHAHSVETWSHGELVGGLYFVNLGQMVFGESMFAHRTDASKTALAALLCCCLVNNIPMIDCQQNTLHLASLGAAEISRADLALHLSQTVGETAPHWRFEPAYWSRLLSAGTPKPP